MNQLTLNCTIDGRRYTCEELAQIEHDRQLYVLHEMNGLGATIKHGGRTLSDDDIDLLGLDDARNVGVAARTSYGVEGIAELFEEQLRASDRMWKDANDAPAGAPLLSALADVTVTGLSVDEFRCRAGTMAQTYAQLNPDHYFFHEEGHRARAMETFGMYGGPSDVYVVSDPTIVVPIEPDPGYSLLSAGYSTLCSDGTNINVLAFHQIKPSENGLALKLGAFFPPKTPQELVDGHKVHMAIELWRMCTLDVPSFTSCG